MNLVLLAWIIPAFFLMLAPLDWPYAYYQLLRVVVCVSSAYLAYRSASRGRKAWPWILAAIALLYNPLATLHLGRALWTLANIATVAVLAVHWWTTERTRGPE